MKSTLIPLYVGSYTSGANAVGIRSFTFDTETGALVQIGQMDGIENASFLAFGADGATLYAVSETSEYEGREGGSVAAYRLGPEAGKLTLLNRQPTYGGAPCHLSVNHEGNALYVANYSSGTVCVFPIEAGGALSPASDIHRHAGSGPNAARQQGPYAHSVTVSPDGRFVVAADLGIDRLIVYAVDPAGRKLTRHGEATLHPGAGPRHVAFSRDAAYLYAVNELDSTVTACAYDAAAGALTALQTVPTLPEGVSAAALDNTCADIHLSPDGRFLYASNRGHDSIAIYAIDAADGRLTSAGHASTLGRTPRNFALSPDGRFLLAANQESDSIVVFRRDSETGQLTATGQTVAVPLPICIRMLA